MKTVVATVALAALAVAAPTTAQKKVARVDDPASAQVTNSGAFDSGAGNNNNSNIQDSSVAPNDAYKCYYGDASAFPPSSKWISFENMFNNYKPAMAQGCSNLGLSPDDTGEQIGQIYNAIQQVGTASLVDHRYILATIMQESIGCVNVGRTNNGVNNPGLMQSHDGSSFVGGDASTDDQQASITQMVIDGTQGTSSGDGLVQGINMYGNIYEAARYYNSGQVNQGDLNDPQDATASYVTDIANRMTGWVNNGDFSQC